MKYLKPSSCINWRSFGCLMTMIVLLLASVTISHSGVGSRGVGLSPLRLIEGGITPLEIIQKTFVFSPHLSLFWEEVCKSIISKW